MMRVVLTGTTYSGKTDLSEALGKEGYYIVPEAETPIVQRLNLKVGQERIQHLILGDYSRFKETVGRRQARLESRIVAADNQIVIQDRCAIDWIAYCKLRNAKVSPILENLAKQYNFQYVFFCEMLSRFDERRKEGRVMTKEEAIRLNELITLEYTIRGYKPIPVKEMRLVREENIAARLAYIKQILSSSPAHS